MTEYPNRDALWRPALIVFISNACVMTIELVAGRLLAPYVGVSLYTWTSVIGVILAGMSIGNYVGGRLADRAASRQLLGAVFVLAGLGSFSVLATTSIFGERGLPAVDGAPLIGRMLLYVTLIFLLPSGLLGMISPIVVKLSLQDLRNSGSVVGRIYAASALGSIVGTFATGYFLISAFGTRAILIGVGAVLIAMGALFGRWMGGVARPAATAAIVLLAALVLAGGSLRSALAGPCLRETDYFCIRVRDETRNDGESYRVLTLDRLVHSYSSLDDPRKLVYNYEKVGAEVLAFTSERRGLIDAFFIGGGGYTLPRYIEAVHPNSIVEVAEIDPEVTRVAQSLLGLPVDTRVVTHSRDARLALLDLDPDRQYNLIVGDAFNDFSVPYHLTTREFNDLVRRHLTDDGIYMLNLIDGGNLPFVSAMLRTLQQSFEHVYFVPINRSWENTPRNTFIVLASPRPIDIEALRAYDGGDGMRHIDAWLASPEEMRTAAAMGTGIVLTDDYVPTDNLLAPMFEAS
jgi:spermidine synthase